MKRTLVIVAAGFITGCLLARLALGADQIYVWCDAATNAVGGYEFQAHRLSTISNMPPVPPLVWQTNQPRITIEALDAKLTAGAGPYLVLARALGGEQRVTNATHGVLTNHVANGPWGRPRLRELLAPVDVQYVTAQAAHSLASMKSGTNWIDVWDGALWPTNAETYLRLKLGK